MDLSSMLNDGPVPEKRTSQPPPPQVQHTRSEPPRPHVGSFQPPPQGGYPTSRSDVQTPGYGPLQTSNQLRGLTPLQTPSFSHPSGQFPFPQQATQSPGPQSAIGQPYRPYEPHTATTPGPRPSSRGVMYGQPSPSHGISSGGPLALPGNASHSPTPSSNHSQTPHSVRQSPLVTMMSLPGQQTSNGPGQHFNMTQPTTPLGPPPVLQRNSSQYDHPSPYHGRTLSGASNSIMSGSPAQSHPNMPHLTSSPRATQRRPSPQRRSTSDFANNADRERSLSVSPKTKLPARTPSLQSHSSSHADVPSARSSVQPSAHPIPPSEASSISSGHQQQAHAAPFQHHMHSSHDSSGQPSIARQSDAVAPESAMASSLPPVNSGHVGLALPQKMSGFQQPSPTHSSQDRPTSSSNLRVAEPPQPPAQPLKRPAESDSPQAVAQKRPKRRHATRPIWAELDRQNPRFDGTSAAPIRPQQQQAQQSLPPRPEARRAPQGSQASTLQPNGAHINGNHIIPATTSDAIDTGLVRTRQVLGPWERCMCRDPPAPGMLIAVQDWLWGKLSELREVGTDPLEGSIEIEAKIGTLVDINTDMRFKLPVISPVVVHEDFNRNIRFESQMIETQHMAMNKFLNKTLQETMRKENEAPSGRVPMIYKHIYETDSFQTLSPAGIAALPPAFQRRAGRELRLRTTVDDKTGKVVARIVKVHIANLHIHSPMDPYDCRITINLEVNLDRPDLDPNLLAAPPRDNNPKGGIERKKDRLSYKHLAYSIDLTKVLIKGLGPSYELELELDAAAVRKQMDLMLGGEENAYSAMVEGFLDNATYLMRNRP